MLIILFGIILPIILGVCLLMIEAFISGWSVDLHQWDDLPNDGEIINRA